MLTQQIMAIDMRIAQALGPESSKLQKWIEQQMIKQGSLILLKNIFSVIATKSAGVLITVFQARAGATKKAAYFDTRPALMASYIQKTNRLKAISGEIFGLLPPSQASLDIKNLPKREACYMSKGALR